MSIEIPPEELVWKAIRASGPGGQNVNKVSSAVELRFDARHSPSLRNDVAIRLMRLAGGRLNKEGVIVIQAQRFRDLPRNREDALARLMALIDEASTPPQKRIATAPSKAEKEKRISSKLLTGQRKKMRGKISVSGD